MDQPTPLDRIGICDHLDVLEESVVRKRPVHVELYDGASFIDQVRDVVTEEGQDFAIFAEKGRVPVRSIRTCIRAEIKFG